MMPKLPTFTTYDDKLNALMFAKQVAEACAAIAQQMHVAALVGDWETFDKLLAEINDAAKEIGALWKEKL